tara:strand:- start:26807 stop:26998 length:192 start_codon:yes stop_codon:yes gene_type:complete
MRGAGLTEIGASSLIPKSGGLAKLNQPLAREHMAHVTGTNKQGEYLTEKPNVGKLGAQGHAGK